MTGTVVKAYVKNGTYYSETLAEGFDPAGPNDSQGYIAEVATRAMIFIQADDLKAFVQPMSDPHRKCRVETGWY